MSLKWFFLGCSVWYALCADAQLPVPTGAILATAGEDLAVGLQSRQLEQMAGTNLNLPFVEQVNLRTETDRFRLQQQEYLARVSVNGFREMNRRRRLTQAERRSEESRREVFRHEALLRRYQALIEYRQLQRDIALQQRFATVYEDKLAALKTITLQDTETDLGDILEAEFDRDQTLQRLHAYRQRYDQLRRSIQTLAPARTAGEWQLDTAGAIPPLQLEAVIEKLPLDAGQHPEIMEKKSDVARIAAEYELTNGQARQVLDFFQLRYANDPNEGLNRDMSVGIGLNLPFRGSARPKMNALILKQNAADNELQVLRAELNEQIAGAWQRLSGLSAQYRQARQRLADNQATYTLQQAAAGQIAQALTLLRAQELLLKREAQLLELEQDMFAQYLDILDWSGLISAMPQVDYLTADLRGF